MQARVRPRRRSGPGPVLLLVVALLAVAAVLAATCPATADGAGSPRSRGGRDLVVGSYNIRGTLPLATFASALDRFRATVDVAVLQEVNTAAKRRHLAAGRGWRSFWSRLVPQTAVTWRAARFRLVSGRGVRIARAGTLPPAQARTSAVRHGLFVTVVRLQDHRGGHRVSVVDVHLVAGAVADGRCVPGRARLCGVFRASVRGLQRVATAERRWSRGRLYLAGDFNDDYRTDRLRHDPRLVYARLTGIGLVAQWESLGRLPAGGGSYPSNGTYLDQVWAPVLPRAAGVERSLDLSDHYPVRAVYDTG